jgi:ATP-dependent Lon protease
MSASRWVSGVIDLFDLLNDDDLSLGELLIKPIVPKVIQENKLPEENAPQKTNQENEIPEVLPILPLRGLVVYPYTAVPLTIGQPRSIKLVDEVVSGEERLIGLIASKNPELETPSSDELYQIGTVAIVHRLFKAPDNTIRLVVQGLARFSATEYIEHEH